MKLTFQVSLRLADGRMAAGRIQESSEGCPCGHCWCGKSGSGATVEAVWKELLLSLGSNFRLTSKPVTVVEQVVAPAPAEVGTSVGPSEAEAEDQEQPVTNGTSTSEPAADHEAQVLQVTSGRQKPKMLKRKVLAFREFLLKYRRTNSSSNVNRSEADQQPGLLTSERIATLDKPETARPSTSVGPQQNLDSTVDSEQSFRINVARYYRNRRRAANLSFLNSSVASVSSFCGLRPPTTRVTRAQFGQRAAARHQQRPLTPFVGQRIYECEECSRTYVHWANLRLHKQRSHQGSKRFRCVECPRSFETHKGLRIHDARMHPSKEEDNGAPSGVEDSHFGSREEEENEPVAPPCDDQRANTGEVSPPVASPHPSDQLNTLGSPAHSHISTTPPQQSSLSDNQTQSPDSTSSTYSNLAIDNQLSMESNNSNLPRRSVLSASEAQSSSVEIITLEDDTCDSSFANRESTPCSSHYHGSTNCTHAKTPPTPQFFKAPGIPCRYCPLTFKEASDLDAHQFAVHNANLIAPPLTSPVHLKPRFQCRFCPLAFSSSPELNAHQHMHLNSSSSWGESPLYTRRPRRPEDLSWRKPAPSMMVNLSRSSSSSCLEEGPKYTSFCSPSSSQELVAQRSAVSLPAEQTTPRLPNSAHARQAGARIKKDKRFACPYCPARTDKMNNLKSHIKRNHSFQVSNSATVSSNWRR